MHKKIISALLVICLLCSPLLLPSASADKKKSKTYDKKISELQKREKEYEKQLKKTRADIQAKEKYSAALVSQIEVLGKQIKESHAEIEKINKRISKKQKAIKKAKADIETQINALKKRIRESIDSISDADMDDAFYSGEKNALAAVLIMVRDALTVDAAPVAHGRWTYPRAGGDGYPFWNTRCSVCVWETPRVGACDYKFCPNCGAKMDGERREDDAGV